MGMRHFCILKFYDYRRPLMKKEFLFFVNDCMSTEKSSGQRRYLFHYESSARKSNLLVQSGGGGVCVNQLKL